MNVTLTNAADVDEFHDFTETGGDAAVLDRYGYVWVVTEDDRGDLYGYHVEDTEISWQQMHNLVDLLGPLTVIHDPRGHRMTASPQDPRPTLPKGSTP
ncbi:MAG TPA: hypothetical protein VIL68_05990 [Propionibacteriaceae bacterium]